MTPRTKTKEARAQVRAAAVAALADNCAANAGDMLGPDSWQRSREDQPGTAKIARCNVRVRFEVDHDEGTDDYGQFVTIGRMERSTFRGFYLDRRDGAMRHTSCPGIKLADFGYTADRNQYDAIQIDNVDTPKKGDKLEKYSLAQWLRMRIDKRSAEYKAARNWEISTDDASDNGKNWALATYYACSNAQAVREHEEGDRAYFGIIVTVEKSDIELAEASVWGCEYIANDARTAEHRAYIADMVRDQVEEALREANKRAGDIRRQAKCLRVEI